MAGLKIEFSKLYNNLRRATARVLIVGTLLLMILVVFIGTIFVLRISFSPITKQYSDRLQRTLQRVAVDFESLDGRVTFSNAQVPNPDSTGIPVFKLPLDYLNVIPGHVEDLKTLAACSYVSKYQSKDRMCAGIVKNRAYGSLLYIRGSFESLQALTSPISLEDPFSAHHFIVDITARGRTSRFVLTLDHVQRAEQYISSPFSPAWSLNGFKTSMNIRNAWSREPEIKGRVLKVSNELNRYEYIFQAPIYAYADDALLNAKPWPPLDLSTARVALKLIKSENGKNEILFDSVSSDRDTIFSFQKMRSYLSTGEQFEFFNEKNESVYKIKANSQEYFLPQSNLFRTFVSRASDKIIKFVLPIGSTQQIVHLTDGHSIAISGDASIVFEGWREAAQTIIAFAFILIILLISIMFLLYFVVLLPLNRVRKNTLYMKSKFSDAKDFKMPYSILNKHDEVGVLWASISALHSSITSYGRKAQERIERESFTLRAIGHEIRSPLQDLMLRHKENDDPSTRSVHRIFAAVRVLTHMYSGSKIDPEKGPQGAINALSGNLTIEDVSEYLRNAADSEIERVRYKSEDSNLKVYVDADLLELALTDILNNANDFRTDGTEIVITTYSDHSHVLIRIANQGPKIKVEPIEQIFEYGVSSRISESEKGHQGLGLFHAKKYIEEINGELSVKNTDNGVVFEIKLIRA